MGEDDKEKIQRLEAENHELRTTLDMIRRGFACYSHNIAVIIDQAIGAPVPEEGNESA